MPLFRFFATACALAALAVPLLASATDRGEGACMTPGGWFEPGEMERPIALPGLIERMSRKAVVLVGEQHDDEDHHRWQLQVLAALHARRPDMVLGFEVFPRRVQPVLDRWVAGELTVKAFLEQVRWAEIWSVPPEQYLPLFHFARINRVPMVALNVDADLIKAITTRGWDAVPEAEREGVRRPVPPAADYRDYLFDVYRGHAGGRGREGAELRNTDTDFVHFIESQTTWDGAMAEALARPIDNAIGGSAPLVVGVMGSGHIRYGYGVAHQLRARGIAEIGSLMPLDAGIDCRLLRAGLADAVFAVPSRGDVAMHRPKLGVQLETQEGSVAIAAIMPGSLAERTGLQQGDRILTLAGAKAGKISAVVGQIRQQPAGTWLPMTVRRGDKVIDFVVKFPADEMN